MNGTFVRALATTVGVALRTSLPLADLASTPEPIAIKLFSQDLDLGSGIAVARKAIDDLHLARYTPETLSA